jgi:hypothetical protein
VQSKEDAKAAAQRRQRTGKRSQLYDVEDERWEEEFRKKKALEKQGGGPGGPTPEEVIRSDYGLTTRCCRIGSHVYALIQV